MPQNKVQHFVPRVLLKPFSLNAAGAAISLYQGGSQKAVRNAPLKNQCARNYFYGRDLRLEKLLGGLEGTFANVLHSVKSAHGDDLVAGLEMIRQFTFLQHNRTEAAVIRRQKMMERMYEAAQTQAGSLEPPLPELDYTQEQLVHDALALTFEAVDRISDLSPLLVRNDTETKFVISDDPAVLTNRIYLQRLQRNDFGLSSAGAILAMPLSPTLLFILYDRATYTVPNKSGSWISVRSSSDAAALNELQYLNARKLVYFSEWDQQAHIRSACDAVWDRRVERHSLQVMVPIEEVGPNGAKFRLATPEEADRSPQRLIVSKSSFPRPKTWFSELKIRGDARGHSNGSMAGWLRTPEGDSVGWRRVRF